MSQSSFVCTQLNGFKYCYFTFISLFNTNQLLAHSWIVWCKEKGLNSSIWPIDGTLTGTTTLGQSGSGNNGNKGVL